MSLKWDSLPTSTATLLSELALNDEVSPFILIGGTALALQYGHRISEDLDFISLGKKLDQQNIDHLIDSVKGQVQKTPHDVMTVLEFEDHGLNIDDYHQDYVVDTEAGKVKLTFLVEGDNKIALERSNTCQYEKLRYASPKMLFSLKSLALTFRHKKRDLFDLKFLMEQGIGGLDQSLTLVDPNYYPIFKSKLLTWPQNDLLTISFKDQEADDMEIGEETTLFFESSFKKHTLIQLKQSNEHEPNEGAEPE